MTEKGVTPAIGIDLGIGLSCVGVWHQNEVKIILNEVDIQKLAGRRFNDPQVQEFIKCCPFKVIKGTYGLPKVVVEYKGKEMEYSPEEISSMLLVQLKKQVESYIGTTVKGAVITVPAYFNESQRQATKVAAHLAGLDVLQIIDEPVAAAIAYGLHKKTADTNMLVFDLDCVTFDASIVTIDEKSNLIVKATGGDTHFGGNDIDNMMVDYFVNEFNKKHQIVMDGNLGAQKRLLDVIQKAIGDLIQKTETTISIYSLYNGIDFSTIITRSEFERICESFFSRGIETLESFLIDANVNKADVNGIVLNGWCTMIPKVRQMLQEFFNGKELLNSIIIYEVVAHGATIHAANLIREKSEKAKTFPLLDIVPLSLGVDAHDGVFSVIIPRKTPIPAEKEQIYFTAVDNQSRIHFNVYQGERSRAKDNNWLGEFEFAVSPAPKGKSKVKVVFSINANGTLNCKVKDFTTGLKKKIIIDYNKEKLSDNVIKKMVNDAKKYKLEDQEYIKIMCARNVLQEYIYNVNKKMKTIGSTDKTTLHADEIKKMENAIETANRYIDGLVDVDEYQKVLDQLEKLCVGVIAQLV